MKNKSKVFALMVALCIGFFLCPLYKDDSIVTTSFETSERNDGVPESLYRTSLPHSASLNINITSNATRIGRYRGANVTLDLQNNVSNQITNIEINWTLEGQYGKFTDEYPNESTINFLNPGQNTTVEIEVVLDLEENETIGGSVDVVIVLDCSGSMGDEIGAIKTEFLDMIDRLTTDIPDLRVGMVVFGWNKYSEYPYSSTKNYIDLTSDFDTVNYFIGGLFAQGTKEPWGDALYVANTFSWRDDAAKLLILVGDEDCDPGNLIGKSEQGEDYYNGSQLVDIVSTLKEKGVKISTVICGGASEMAINQFQWVARATDGESVFLEEMLSGEDPITLPELIEGWTLELSREFALTISANVQWIDEGETYSANQTIVIWVDVAPPSIHTSCLTLVEEGDYTVQIFAEVLDISDISHVNLYWTFDFNYWHFTPMNLVSENNTNYFYHEITGLSRMDNFSYWIEASDVLSNFAETALINITVEISTIKDFTKTTFSILQDDTHVQFFFEACNSGKYYLWIKSNELTDADYNLTMYNSSESVSPVFNSSLGLLFELDVNKSESIYVFYLTMNKTQNSITTLWTPMGSIFDSDLSVGISETYQTKLFLANIEGENSTYLSLTYQQNEDLIVNIAIFDSDWNFTDQISGAGSIELQPGTYYVWITRVVRSGVCLLTLGEEIFETDPYYTNVPTRTQYTYEDSPGFVSFNGFFVLFTLFCVLIPIRIYHRRKITKVKK